MRDCATTRRGSPDGINQEGLVELQVTTQTAAADTPFCWRTAEDRAASHAHHRALVAEGKTQLVRYTARGAAPNIIATAERFIAIHQNCIARIEALMTPAELATTRAATTKEALTAPATAYATAPASAASAMAATPRAPTAAEMQARVRAAWSKVTARINANNGFEKGE
jgi:hypothetical protein